MLSIILFCSVSILSLINQLGSDEYSLRNQAYKKLQNIGYVKLQYLKNNFDNEDLEIALSCQRLYDEYYYIRDPSGKLPSILYLPHQIRYPKGISYSKQKCNNGSIILTINQCDTDISLEYYERAAKLIGQWHCATCCEFQSCIDDWNENDGFCIICGFYNSFELKNEQATQSFATKLYITDLLNSGANRNEVQNIVNQLYNNQKTNAVPYAIIKDEVMAKKYYHYNTAHPYRGPMLNQGTPSSWIDSSALPP